MSMEQPVSRKGAKARSDFGFGAHAIPSLFFVSLRLCVRPLFIFFACVSCAHSQAAEPKVEHLRGVLEKTMRADASAQITDSLGDTYYVAKTEATEKRIVNFVGKPKKVVVTGLVEARANGSLYFQLKTIELAKEIKK